MGIKPRDRFEIGFNRATWLAAVGDMEAAETAVKAAYKQGKSTDPSVYVGGGAHDWFGGCQVMDGRMGEGQ